MIELTRSQLALYNGTDREPIYVAFEGDIYDLTASKLWRNGQYYQHWAGQDLTAELAGAPHTRRVFDRFEPIGRLLR